jgi:DNA-binding transcriptional LysR family regulator
MEARFGVRLVERSSRSFRLTDAGALLHERAQRIVAAVVEVEAELRTKSKHRSRKPQLPSVGVRAASASDTGFDTLS